LSIVKEIVDLSGGTIDVRSELGRGTDITLSLPLENYPMDPTKVPVNPELLNPDGLVEEPVAAVRRRAHGRTVTIRGFEHVPGSSDLQNISLSGLKASIETYITDWFKLEITSDDAAADILICDESAFVHSSATELKFQALLILCSNSARRDIYTSKLDASQSIEFVGKPCGPHRLAKAFLNCFDTEDAMKLTTEQPVSQTKSCNKITAFNQPQLAKMTVNTRKSLRLIGNLQSPIGFSPTTNLNKMPKVNHSTETTLKRRPEVWHRAPEAKKINLKKEMSSETATSSSNASDPSSTSFTPNSSTSQLKQEPDQESAVSAIEKNGSVPVPKMLLVEVRSTKQFPS
jgi:hypothetical protein